MTCPNRLDDDTSCAALARLPTYRRSPALISYWQDGTLLLENYARREKTEATPIVLEVLDALTDWQPATALHARLKKIPPALIDDLLEALVTHGLVDRDEQERADGGRTAALDAWKSWTPAASYFHLATKDVPFTPRAETNRTLKKRAIDTPPPPHLKESRREGRIALPAPASRQRLTVSPAADSFTHVLTERRTWRRFGTRAMSLDELGTLLGMTFGVQDWIEVDGWGRMPLKTAPSGGARHSIEAYVLVRHVGGVKPGLYHYQPAAHELHPIRTKPARAAAADIRAYLPRQELVRLGLRADPDDRGVSTRAVALSVRARLPHGDRRGRASLPERVSGRDVAGPRAVLHDGAGRQPDREGSRHRRAHRIGDLRGGRRPAAEERRLGALAGHVENAGAGRQSARSGARVGCVNNG